MPDELEQLLDCLALGCMHCIFNLQSPKQHCAMHALIKNLFMASVGRGLISLVAISFTSQGIRIQLSKAPAVLVDARGTHIPKHVGIELLYLGPSQKKAKLMS